MNAHLTIKEKRVKTENLIEVFLALRDFDLDSNKI